MLAVGVLYGGRSGEHDVSLCSAASVIAALDQNKYKIVAIGIDRDGRWYVQESPVIIDDKDFGKIMSLEKKGTWYCNIFPKDNRLHMYNSDNGSTVMVDVVIPAVHGTYCEDGTLQGLLELAMVPYVGADVAGSAIGMNKDVSKRLLRDAGIPVVPWQTIMKYQWDENPDKIIEKAKDNFELPLFIKPVCAGSSVGVRKVTDASGLSDAIEFAFQYDNKIIVEKGINAREIECAVLGNDCPEASVLGEIVPHHEFYSYESKYIDPDGAELIIPAELNTGISDAIRRTAVDAFRILNCSGMARVDFFVEKGSDAFYLNEINTIPGFTTISMYPKLWAYSGVSYSELITKLIDLALERHQFRKIINTDLQK